MLLAVSAVASACISTFADEKPPEVESACSSEPCQSFDTLEELTGFRPAEPAYLPDRFVLFRRQTSTDIDVEESKAVRPSSVAIEYRLLGSPFVPALTVVELVVRDATRVELALEGRGCGETRVKNGRTLYYGEGIGGPYSADDDLSRWTVCIAPGPGDFASYAAYFVAKNVIVEVKAFPESGVTLEDVLRVSESIQLR